MKITSTFKATNYSLNSDITFESNLFTDLMPGIDHCIDCGTGIYSEVNDGMTHSILIAGGTGSVTKNNFNVDVSHGIISNGPINLTISECIFNGNNYNSIKITKNRNSIVSIENSDFLNAGEKSISMYSNTSCDFNILNNRFTNVITGIFAQNYAKCDVKIGDNIFNNSGITDVPNSSFHNTAMTLSCYGFDFANTIHIWSNTIDYCRIGIHAENISDIKIGLDPNGIVKFNTINYFLGLTPTSGIYYEGIWLQSCNRAAIINTTILNNAIATGTNMFIGVDVENSTNCQINCNNITNIPYSMNFLGYCAGTLLRRNVMTEYDVAINTMGATLPFQGAEISPGVWKSLDNEWYDLGTSNRIGTLSQPIYWYYKTPGVQFQPFPNQGNVFPQSAGSGNPQCGDLISPPRDERFGAIVGDSLDFDEYVEENTYTAKADAFQAIKNDSTLLVQGDLNDVAFQEFFSEMSQTNIGGFAEVEELIADSVFVSQAGLLNTSIVDTNSIEFYRKTVNDIYINGPAAGISLTAADSLTLQMIANLQWTLAGDAIYSSANMIGLEIHPVYIPSRIKSIQTDEIENIQTKATGISVYPNPASEKLIVRGLTNQNTSIIIHNSANENVLELEITKYEHVIDVSNYTDGIYYLFVKNKKINHFQTKFSIIK